MGEAEQKVGWDRVGWGERVTEGWGGREVVGWERGDR